MVHNSEWLHEIEMTREKNTPNEMFGRSNYD